jgi:uncharacterized tellurite resistance protein B-like protein
MTVSTLGVFDEPRLAALVELLYIAALADGELAKEEHAFFRRRAQSMTDQRLGEEEIGRLMLHVDEELSQKGRHEMLASIGARIGGEELRKKALKMAVDMMMADRVLKESEKTAVFAIAGAFGIERNVADELLSSVSRS